MDMIKNRLRMTSTLPITQGMCSLAEREQLVRDSLVHCLAQVLASDPRYVVSRIGEGGDELGFEVYVFTRAELDQLIESLTPIAPLDS